MGCSSLAVGVSEETVSPLMLIAGSLSQKAKSSHKVNYVVKIFLNVCNLALASD